MGSLYLTDLSDVIAAAGLNVYEQDSWQTRARSSGGYSQQPNHVIVHHTASDPSADGWPDADYCSYTSDIRPVANLYLDRAGAVYVLAAGATNTNGSGFDTCGKVADDSMNTHAIGIEAGNAGTGESWTPEQQDAYVRLVSALCSNYGIEPISVHSHAEWAPSRKIDPFGPSRFGNETWMMDIFRNELGGTLPAPSPPPIDYGETEMAYYKDDRADGWQIWVVANDKNGNVWTCPINDLPDGGKWDVVNPIVGDPPTRPFGAMIGLMDRQNRPG